MPIETTQDGQTVQIQTDEPIALPPASDYSTSQNTFSSSTSSAWEHSQRQIETFFSNPTPYINHFWRQYKSLILVAGLLLVTFVILRLIFAVVGFVTSIPLLSPLFELVGVGYSGWFIYRYLLTAASRRELSDKIETIKQDILGETAGMNTNGMNAKGMITPNGVSAKKGVSVKKSIVIRRSPEELFQFWRNFENLPQFMNHLQSVTVLDNLRSHWVANAPMNSTVEWDAIIIDETENRSIVWRSLEGADVDSTGSVTFTPVADGSTEVKVTMQYNPPGGELGALAAALFGENPEQQLEEDLTRFKQVMELQSV